MKALIFLALLLGLLTISCKKEVQTVRLVTADSSATDPLNINSTRPDTKVTTARNTNDSVAQC